MTLALRRIRLYLKLALVCGVIAVVLLVVYFNWDRTADVWFFHAYQGIPVLWLILTTAVSSVVGWWGIRKIFGIVREARELRRTQQHERQLQEQRQLAQQVAEREKRIDEKIRRSISDGEPAKGETT